MRDIRTLVEKMSDFEAEHKISWYTPEPDLKIYNEYRILKQFIMWVCNVKWATLKDIRKIKNLYLNGKTFNERREVFLEFFDGKIPWNLKSLVEKAKTRDTLEKKIINVLSLYVIHLKRKK